MSPATRGPNPSGCGFGRAVCNASEALELSRARIPSPFLRITMGYGLDQGGALNRDRQARPFTPLQSITPIGGSRPLRAVWTADAEA